MKFYEYNPSENTGTLNKSENIFPLYFCICFACFKATAFHLKQRRFVLNSKRQLTCVLLFAIVNRVHIHSLWPDACYMNTKCTYRVFNIWLWILIQVVQYLILNLRLCIGLLLAIVNRVHSQPVTWCLLLTWVKYVTYRVSKICNIVNEFEC